MRAMNGDCGRLLAPCSKPLRWLLWGVLIAGSLWSYHRLSRNGFLATDKALMIEAHELKDRKLYDEALTRLDRVERRHASVSSTYSRLMYRNVVLNRIDILNSAGRTDQALALCQTMKSKSGNEFSQAEFAILEYFSYSKAGDMIKAKALLDEIDATYGAIVPIKIRVGFIKAELCMDEKRWSDARAALRDLPRYFCAQGEMANRYAELLERIARDEKQAAQ